MFLRRMKSSFGFKSFLLMVVFAVLATALCGGTALAANETTITFNVIEAEGGDDEFGPHEEIDIVWEKNQEYTSGSDEEAVFTASFAVNRFVSITIDDTELTRGDEYAVSATGDITTITFKSSYLETLSKGSHTILVYYLSDDVESEIGYFSVETYISVIKSGDPDDPGDPGEPDEPGEPGDDEEDDSEMDVPNTGALTVGSDGQGGMSGASVIILGVAFVVIVFVVGKITIGERLGWGSQGFAIRGDSKKTLLRASCVVVVMAGVACLVVESVRAGLTSATGDEIELSVTTRGNIEGDLTAGGDMVKVVDTVRVDTNALRYNLYVVSAGEDSDLHSATTEDVIRPNTSTFLLDDNSWGFTAEESGSVFYPVSQENSRIFVTGATGDRAETRVYYAARVDEDFAAGEYSGTVEYSVIAEMDRALTVAPRANEGLEGGARVSIVTPLVKNGNINISAPSVKIGSNDCASVEVVANDNSLITVSCNIPTVQVGGGYDVRVSFSDLGYRYTLEDGFEYQVNTPDDPDDPDDPDAPDDPDDPEGPEYYTVTAVVDNPSFGSVEPSQISVPEGTAYDSTGNTIAFGDDSDMVVITATPNEVAGYNVICDGWSPSRGVVHSDMTVTATCYGEPTTQTITYRSNNDKNQTVVETKENNEIKSIRALADFAGVRYSNVYSLNSEQYQNWTKEGYYFAYWEGSDGKKYIPDDDGYRNTCGDDCLTSYSGNTNLILDAHYNEMNGVNKAAIMLAWPSATNTNSEWITSNIPRTNDILTFFNGNISSVSYSNTVSFGSPYDSGGYSKYRYRVAPTPEFEAAAMKYYTREELTAAGDPTTWYQYIYLYNNPPANISDPGYSYGRSCDRFASISAHYGIKGLEGGSITMSFGLSGIARYFGHEGDNGAWISPNSEVVSVSGSSMESQVESGAGRSELDYLPGDIRLAYRGDTNFNDYVATCDGHTYELGHAAVYVKTEDGVGHIAEAAHSAYKKNSSSYTGDWLFAATAYSNGGFFGRLTEHYDAKDNQCYTIWRHED